MTNRLPPAVSLAGITKRFPGVVALRDVSFEIAAGSCHALCGENGAGKSTLGKILAGIQTADAGRMLVHGRSARFRDPRDALAAGVGMVHQELAFCDNLSVAENLCLGALPTRGGLVSRREITARARSMLDAIGAEVDVGRTVGELTTGQQQLVQIAAAVGSGARVLVLDEPTSCLTQGEAERLYALIARLRATGVSCVYVSHRMGEIFRLCDTVTVLRDGAHVATLPARDLDVDHLTRLMIGRDLDEYFPRHSAGGPPTREVLRVEGLSSPGRFENVSFSLRAGEILGLAGLVGAGRSEVAAALFGLDPRATGTIMVDGAPVNIPDPRAAMRMGFGLVPEDRKRAGLVLGMCALHNITLPFLERLSRLFWILRGQERAVAEGHFRTLGIRAPGLEAPTAGLSGGNQQKLVLAKWLAAGSRILILDEPTRGVDVGAKAEIHRLIDRLASEGTAILLISSELPELINLATRIVVLHDGRIVGEMARDTATQEGILGMMVGVGNGPRSASGRPTGSED